MLLHDSDNADGNPGDERRAALTSHDLGRIAYDDLRRSAARLLASERAGHTLQPTALANEAWIRVAAQDRACWSGRTHFCAVAAEMMRRILVDHARARSRVKRGGRAARVALDAELLHFTCPTDAVSMDAALRALESVNARAARLVVLRFYGGLSVAEAAEAVGVSDSTAEREWRYARAWLHDRLNSGEQ